MPCSWRTLNESENTLCTRCGCSVDFELKVEWVETGSSAVPWRASRTLTRKHVALQQFQEFNILKKKEKREKSSSGVLPRSWNERTAPRQTYFANNLIISSEYKLVVRVVWCDPGKPVIGLNFASEHSTFDRCSAANGTVYMLSTRWHQIHTWTCRESALLPFPIRRLVDLMWSAFWFS